MSIDGSSGLQPEDPAADRSRDAEQAAKTPTERRDTGGQRRAETLTREEYSDAMRGNGRTTEASPHDHHAEDDSQARTAAGTETRHRADQGPDRTQGSAALATAETPTREEYAEAMRQSTAGAQDQGAAVPAVTHFHAEFKGRPLDLYTDGTRWAAADTPRQEETVSGKGELPDQPPAGEDPPENSSLLERLRREVYEESEDEIDLLEKDSNLVHDVFARPPTGSYEGTAPNQPVIHGVQHAGIDAGSAATAVFTLGLVIDRAARWVVQHYDNRVKGS